MQCKYCKSTEFKHLFGSKNWSIVRCKRCDLVRTQIDAATDYHRYHRDEEYQVERKVFANIFKKRYNIISRIKKSPAKVLDIGASTGTMLDIFKQNGYETYGIEPSDSYKKSKAKGHTVFHSTIENAHLKPESFDIVIINHTLEHVDDPLKVLQIIFKILKKGGLLYIDVPHFGSLSSQLAGKNWKYLLPREHIHQFEKKTLSQIVRSAGFRKMDILTWSGIFDVSNPLALIFYKLFHAKKSVFSDILGIPGNVIATLANRGTNLVIIARK